MTELPFPHQKGKLLREFSTFGIGGPARYFAEAKTISQMQEMLAYAYHHALPIHILGKGSNSLFDDKGFSGLVILNRIDYLEHLEDRFQVGSGYSFPRLGGMTSRGGYSGLEFASGIPATVGGAVYMNAGANGKETADCLTDITFVDEKGEAKRFLKSALHFGYRSSSFQQWKGAIVEAVFHLSPSKEAKIHQKTLLDYRLKTQPYGDKSAGCAFRNPEGDSAGRLIEACGLKGMQEGQACVSDLHANFIVNKGGAKASDVLALIAHVKEKVYREKGLYLEEEIRYVPYV